MNNQKQEIIEHAKKHAEIRLWENKKTQEKKIFIGFWHYFYQGEKDWFSSQPFNLGGISEEEIKILPAWFETAAEELIKDLAWKEERARKEKEPDDWEYKKTIHRACSDFCGCGKEVNHA